MAENIKHTKTAQLCGFPAARVLAAGGSSAEWTSTVEPACMTLLDIIQPRLGCVGVFTQQTPSIPAAFSSSTEIAERAWESNRPHCLRFSLRFHSWQTPCCYIIVIFITNFLLVTNKNVISTLQLIHFLFCSIGSLLHFSNSCVCL